MPNEISFDQFERQVRGMQAALANLSFTTTRRGGIQFQSLNLEQEHHMNITSVDQMEELPTGTTVTVQKPTGDESWRRLRSGRWSRTDARRGDRGLATRFFTGSIEASAVRVAEAGAGDTETEVQPGQVYMYSNDAVMYVVISKRQTRWNVVQMGSNNALAFADRAESDFTGPQWTLYTGDASIVGQRYASYFTNMMTALKPLLELARVEVPENLTTAMVTYAEAHPDEQELFAALMANGVDVSVPTKAVVAGTSTLDGDVLAEVIGVESIASGSGLSTDWTVEVDDVKVRRGCICDVPWAEAVVDETRFLAELPAVRNDDFTVRLTCPQHPSRR